MIVEKVMARQKPSIAIQSYHKYVKSKGEEDIFRLGENEFVYLDIYIYRYIYTYGFMYYIDITILVDVIFPRLGKRIFKVCESLCKRIYIYRLRSFFREQRKRGRSYNLCYNNLFCSAKVGHLEWHCQSNKIGSSVED